MIAFPEMLVPAAEKAGIKVPSDVYSFNQDEYPHFAVYINCQLGASMPYMGCHWENAKIIAEITEDKIRTINFNEILKLGFHYAQ